MGRIAKWAVRCALVLMTFAPLAQAQVGTSTLTGRVTDPTGAVVAGVAVTITNTETNFRFSSNTNEEGLYRVLSLAPGPYHLTFEAAGFKRVMREDITLRTGDVLAVNASLELGSVADSVEVTGAPPLLETETSAVGSIVRGETLYKLPTFQRYVNYTLHLQPGMTTAGAAHAASLTSFHLAGQRAGAIGFGFANSPYNYYPTFVGAQRPNVTGKPQLRDHWRDFGGDRFTLENINPIMDMSYFSYPAAFTPGNLGRGVVTGLPLICSRGSAEKNFRLRNATTSRYALI
jgi:hypothetical protein